MRRAVFAIVAALIPLAAVARSGGPADDMAATGALFRAIRMSDHEAAETSLVRGANVNGRSDEGDTPLMYAALYATTNDMRLLLDRGADPNARDKRGGTALMRSVHDRDKVRLLLKRGVDVDARSAIGVRALMVAAAMPRASEIVKLLLAHKADPTTPDANGITPLMYAVDLGDLEIVKALVAAGAGINAGRGNGATPMLWAANGPTDILLWLLQHGGNANAAHGSGMTPLMVAAQWGATENIKALIEHGAMVNARTDRGTPLIFAAGGERAGADAIRLLLDRGADPNAVAKRCVRCIHEPRADDGSTDLTALMLARQRGETDIVRMLTAAGATR